MFENGKLLLALCTISAAIPAGIWLYFLFHKNERSKKTVALVFALGCLTPPALLGLQYFWDIFPRFNLQALIENNVTSTNANFVLVFILFAAMEEIIKHHVISAIDRRTILIQNIDDAIRYSLASALGFAFVENIYYLSQFWGSISTGELVGMFIFRSLFTAAAHMIFSGIYGYYYGIAKFSPDISDEQKLLGENQFSAKIIAKIFNLPKSQAYQQQMILKGLIIAIGMHTMHNYLLQFSITFPVIIFDVLGFIFLQYLLQKKSSHINLATDISEKAKSALNKKDEEAVIELIGIWFKEKRYRDVIEICDRLLKKDPDNKVVQLLKAQANDKLSDKETIKEYIGKKEDPITDNSLLGKYLAQKPKTQSKTPNSENRNPQETETIIKRKTNTIEKLTGDGTFKLS